MIVEDNDDNTENNILYELLIYAEWQQEPEVQLKQPDKDDKSEPAGYLWKFLRPLVSEPCPPISVRQLTNLQMPWTFAVGGDGAVVAILQDVSLEIRSSRDEYGAVIGRTLVPRDPYPQWRKILWSPDCTMLVLAHSNGKIDFYDLIGAHMFTIEPKTPCGSEKANLQHSIAGMAFSDVRVKNTQWSYELLAADYQGVISSYFVSASDGYKEDHTFNFCSYYPTGISSFVYHSKSNIILVCGKSHKLPLISKTNEALQMGISAWRVLAGSPYYKLSLTLEEQMSDVWSRSTLWNFVSRYNLHKSLNQDLIFKMSVSSNGNMLSAIHVSGALSIWDLPSLRLKKYWNLHLQPNYADINPQYCEPGMRRKAEAILSDVYHSHIIDINWWSNEALIMVRRCGAVTVSSTNSLRNLLGISPEWFEPSPAVTSFCDRGFLALEVETQIKSKKRTLEEQNLEYDESSDDEDPSVFAYTTDLAKRALYFITDNERFQPPRKKMKMMLKTYRLLCLKSTTPEELYTRKINNEEYGEALALAKTYNLDCDLVYQRQWRKMPATVNSIHDYLSKITKRSWVLHECIERVPESFEAAKELLLYGLQGTDIEALIAIGKGEDHGRFILCQHHDDQDDDSFYDAQDEDDVYKRKKDIEHRKRAELLKQVNFKKLTLEQKQLCQCRLKLLMYLDRLTTYEMILGGTIMAEDHYDHNFFKQFRKQSGLEASIHFACNSNWQAIATLFTFHGAETLPHRLAILSHFPETTSPIEYQSLLPFHDNKMSTFAQWEEQPLRDLDWCESKYQKIALAQAFEDYIDEFYEKYEKLQKYRKVQLAAPLVTEWFIQRTEEIEARSGLVDNALDIIKLGIQRNIKGLERLHDDLTTLDILIYDCHIKSDLYLKDYQELPEFEKVKLIMSAASDQNFIQNLRQWLLPFLKRCEMHDRGSGRSLLKSYILYISKNELSRCRMILENSKSDAGTKESPIIEEMNVLLSLGLECIYCCEKSDQLKNASAMFDLLTTISTSEQNIKTSKKIASSLSELKKHISVAEILEKNGLSVTLSSLKNISANPEECKKLFTKLTRMASHKSPILDEAGWKHLLSDVLVMQKQLFTILPYEDCYEIVLHSLLCSGTNENITFAGKMMECNNKQRRDKYGFPLLFKLPYAKSVNLVLTAAREYFNSSSTANDPCMSLAKACLNLMEDVPASIEEELDLIQSLTLLQEFNVNMLPLQVRLCENRISLIQEALKKKDRAYKKSQKIMQLAYLLRAGGNNNHERAGNVLTLIAEQAFHAKDYNECYNACKQLIEKSYQDGWMICYNLGDCGDYQNTSARLELMSFSLAHCSEDLMETILKSISVLHLQVLQDRVKFLLGDNAIELIGNNQGDNDNTHEAHADTDNTLNTLWHTGGKTLKALHSTTQTTKAVLTSVGSTQFWKDAVKWIQPLGISWNEETYETEDTNKNLDKQGICAFYSSLIKDAHMSSLEANYHRYARPDLNQSQEVAMCILRASLLDDTIKNESGKSCVDPKVLLDLAKVYLSEDVTFSLSFLLSLKEAKEAETLFQTFPKTPRVLQYATVYYAIRTCIGTGQLENLAVNGEFQSDPHELVAKAMALKTASPVYESKDHDFQDSFECLEEYNKMMYDFVQAEVLHSIGGGVDAERFTSDDVYKKDTILGIAMTLDNSVFNTAVSLANHYNVSLWELCMTHIEYLFSENKISATEIATRIEKQRLSNRLLEQVDLFRERLENAVYPGIDGKDHERLSYYFTLMEMCGDKEDKVKLRPSYQKKLLSKFKSAFQDVDYKLLMNPDSSSSYLAQILNDTNVHVFAKAAAKIPKQDGICFQPGNIYCIWNVKQFFEGRSSRSKTPSSKSEWIQRYESCSGIMQSLTPPDVIEFIDRVIFTDEAYDKLTIDCRTEIVKRAVKFCKTKQSENSLSLEKSSGWLAAVSALTTYHQHLQRLEDELLLDLRQSEDPKTLAYCRSFDLSKSSVEKLQNLLSTIVCDGPDLQLLKNFLAFCPPEIGWEPSDAYITAIKVILNEMRQIPTSIHGKRSSLMSPIVTLEAIFEDLTQNKDELFVEDVAVELLIEFCQESNVPIPVKLSILKLLEKTNSLSTEYNQLLLVYQTQAIVSSLWPEFEVSEESVKHEDNRKVLYNQLLGMCRTVTHFDSLAKLLSHWPPFNMQKDVGECQDEAWSKLISSLILLESRDALDAAVNVLSGALKSPAFSHQHCQEVYNLIHAQGRVLHTFKCAFKTHYEDLHLSAIAILREIPEISSEDYDEELLDLILQRHLTPQIVSTSIYKPVIEYLLEAQENLTEQEKGYKLIDDIIKQLASAGYQAEAGSLLLLKDSMHPGLSTFSTAINVLQRWLNSM